MTSRVTPPPLRTRSARTRPRSRCAKGVGFVGWVMAPGWGFELGVWGCPRTRHCINFGALSSVRSGARSWLWQGPESSPRRSASAPAATTSSASTARSPGGQPVSGKSWPQQPFHPVRRLRQPFTCCGGGGGRRAQPERRRNVSAPVESDVVGRLPPRSRDHRRGTAHVVAGVPDERPFARRHQGTRRRSPALAH